MHPLQTKKLKIVNKQDLIQKARVASRLQMTNAGFGVQTSLFVNEAPSLVMN